jgi:hypothetical protein
LQLIRPVIEAGCTVQHVLGPDGREVNHVLLDFISSRLKTGGLLLLGELRLQAIARSVGSVGCRIADPRFGFRRGGRGFARGARFGWWCRSGCRCRQRRALGNRQPEFLGERLRRGFRNLFGGETA